jgi:membrane protein implicated in regulation of membrane protease activity
MSAVTITFLLIGGLGVVLLAVSLLLGDLIPGLDIPGLDADGAVSLPSIAGFVGAFGFGGAAVAALTGDDAAAVAAALVAGLAVAVPAAWGTIALARAVGRMRTDATPTRADLVGRIGVVVTPIPEQGYGEVRISIGGQPVKLNAKSDQPVTLGAHVFVVEAPTDTSVVVEQTPAL